MRKCIYLTLLISLLFTYSCGQKIVLQKGDTIHKEINLSFNPAAIEGNEYLVFEINDDFDFNNLTLLINGKETVDKTFRIDATASNITVPIDFFLKENAKRGKYSFTAKLKEASYNLSGNQNVEYKGEKEFAHKDYIFPQPAWVIILKYGIVILLLIIIAVIIRILCKKFPKGILQITSKNLNEDIELKGKKSFSLKEFLATKEIYIDGDLVLEKKCFGNYNGPVIKNISTFTIQKQDEIASKGDIIFPDETLSGIMDENSNSIKVYYNH